MVACRDRSGRALEVRWMCTDLPALAWRRNTKLTLVPPRVRASDRWTFVLDTPASRHLQWRRDGSAEPA